MIDTLKVYTHDFTVNDNAGLTIQPNTVDYSTGEVVDIPLFKNKAGKTIHGSKAYCNNEKYNLTIKGMPKGGVVCFIQTSMPKACKGENFYSLSDNETRETYNLLQKEIKLLGIGLDLGKCKLSRVDTFKNITGSEMFYSYAPLFSLLRANRQNRRDYGTTFTWSNTRREVCVYDKITEMQNRGMTVSHYPANTIRFEYRLKNSSVCEGEYKVNDFKSLVDNLDGVKQAYRDALEKYLFSLDVDKIEILSGLELEQNMRMYKETLGRNWMQLYYRDYGAYMTAKLAGTETTKAVIVRLSEGDRMKAWRAIKLTEDMKRNYELVKGSDIGKTLSELYLELKEAVLSET